MRSGALQNDTAIIIITKNAAKRNTNSKYIVFIYSFLQKISNKIKQKRWFFNIIFQIDIIGQAVDVVISYKLPYMR